MGKKRGRELEGNDPAAADPNVDKMDEDDEEVGFTCSSIEGPY